MEVGKGVMMDLNTPKVEISYMNIAKAFGIIAVVVGHSGSPLTHFVYLFHMALFYFISGYFYKDFYSRHPMALIKNRLKTLYLPFVYYQLIFLALHNFLFKLNFYSDKIEFAGQGVYTNHLYTGKEFLHNAFSILRFNGTEQLGGALWFLVSLFAVNMLFAVVSLITSEFPLKVSEFSRFAAIAFCFIAGNWMTVRGINLQSKLMLNNSLVALTIYYLGYLFRKYEDRVSINLFSAIVCLAVLVFNSGRGFVNMGANTYPSPLFFLINAAVGIYVVIFCSKLWDLKPGSRLLEFVGNHSLTIMALHFAAFKLANLLQIGLYDYPVEYLAKFPRVDGSHGWWVFNTLVGVSVPLLGVYISGKLRSLGRSSVRTDSQDI